MTIFGEVTGAAGGLLVNYPTVFVNTIELELTNGYFEAKLTADTVHDHNIIIVFFSQLFSFRYVKLDIFVSFTIVSN